MNDSRLAAKVLRMDIPVIVVPVHRVVAGFHHLISENSEAAVLAADHLAGQGLRQFAYIGFDKAIWSLERRDSFCRRLADRGWAVHTRLIPISFSETQIARNRADIVGWLEALPKPVGIMACNDEVAGLVSELCRLRNIRIPEKVALIGVDNDALICEMSVPLLSSVAFATEQAGYEAAELLESLMNGKKVKPQTILTRADRVVVRQSTDLFAIQDEEVVKAIRFIRENSDRLIHVKDVAEATLLSHRTLHTRFCRAVGHSLVKEVKRCRVAHIAAMLTTTNEPIYKIARAMGYETAGHMGRFFQRELGVTPFAYRRSRQESISSAD